MNTDTWYADRIPSPLGELFCVLDSEGKLKRLDFTDSTARAREPEELERQCGHPLHWESKRFRDLRAWLERFFAGEDATCALELAPEGTDFQQRVWQELLRIPHGQTRTYAELAQKVGRPGAARAVGRANATNPIALIVPCHRVIGASGALTGYAGGMDRKRALLELEGALARS